MRRLYDWAQGLQTSKLWRIWLLLALAGAGLLTFVPKPWSYLAVAPIALVGIVLFQAHERRERP